MDTQQLKQARLDKKLLSNVSKMPGYSISRSAWLCDVGSNDAAPCASFGAGEPCDDG